MARALRGRPIIELFAGSAALSAAFASTALLIDADRMLAKVLGRFDEQIVPVEPFTRADYFDVRGRDDWWKYAYCLQAMSFSGVFRHSSRGYNVPHRGGGRTSADPSSDRRFDALELREPFERALRRWRELSPAVGHGDYRCITPDMMRMVGEKPIVVLDPPYEGSRASYNDDSFDYTAYWDHVRWLGEHFDLMLFDRASTLEARGFAVTDTRTMKVNGAQRGDVEAVAIVRLRAS